MDKQFSVMKTVVRLLVVLSCALKPAFGATNDAQGTSCGTVIATSGHKSAPQPPPGGAATNIPENAMFQWAVRGMGTNGLNPCNNGKPPTLGQQPAPTNSIPLEERTVLGPVDVAAVTRLNLRREYFSDQDKYGGILYRAYTADNPLQLINPFAPREYSQNEAAEFRRDPSTGVLSGFPVFSIRFK